jgi:hypothetical protein
MSGRAGLPMDRPAWILKRQEVILRANGRCERCRMRRGQHVHHLRYAKVIGHEPLEWLQLVCLDCHGHYHPNMTFLPLHEQRAKAAQRRKARQASKAQAARCAHCGDTWPKAKHRAVCVKHGLDKPKATG